VEQILYRKPWFTWQLIQTQSLNLHRGLVVLGLVCLILQIGAGFLNNREPQFWNLKNQQQALQKFQNSPQHHFTQVLAALNSLPAQSRTQHIRFNAQGIELRGESLRDSHAILKHWFQQMGAELVHQESRGTANAQIVFTAQINL
jgi:nucleotidyltransferase/DNA polymerase involved in DNA repair